VVIAFVVMGSYWKALIPGLWDALAVGCVDNVLQPPVAGARAEQHPVLIALAVIGGTYPFGVVGFFSALSLVSLVAALLSVRPVAASHRMDDATQPLTGMAGE
jgi:predicted PurR-regulated permease PerM